MVRKGRGSDLEIRNFGLPRHYSESPPNLVAMVNLANLLCVRSNGGSGEQHAAELRNSASIFGPILLQISVVQSKNPTLRLRSEQAPSKTGLGRHPSGRF